MARTQRLASMGVSIKAVTSEAIRVMTTTKPSCLKRMPAKPVRNISGTKTTTVVMVEAVMARAISLAPNMAAAPTRLPFSTCRMMFSSTTMALSTTIPEAMARAMRETRLMVVTEQIEKDKCHDQRTGNDQHDDEDRAQPP